MLLNFYKKPPQYDLYMSKLFNSVILFGIVLHYLIGIWIYGNKNLLYDRNSELNKISNWQGLVNLTSTFGNDIADRIDQPHNYVCVIFLASIIGIVFIRYTFLQIIMITCCKNCVESDVDHLNPIEIDVGKPNRLYSIASEENF